MKKKLTRLTSALALAASFGAAFCVGNADAASLDRVSVVKPDSGAWRGIDSVFVVEAAVRATNIDSNLAVFFWLVEGGTTTNVLPDTTIKGVSSMTDTIAANLLSTTTGALLATRTTPAGATNYVAARGTKQKSIAATVGRGDADSIAVTVKGDSLIYTWYGKVPASTGTFKTVQVAAAAYDPTLTAGSRFSTVKVSGAPRQFSVDGDRPRQTGAAIGTEAFFGAKVVSGFSGGTPSRSVLGIGDTLKVPYDLGLTIADEVLLTDTLGLAASILNKNFKVNETLNRADTFRVNIAEGNFADLFDPASAASDTMGLFVVDVAGNWSSAVIGGINDDVVPNGVTKTVSFLADATRPQLDAQQVNGDTILPVSTDTITNGTINHGFEIDKNPITYNLAEGLDSLVITFAGANGKNAVVKVDPADAFSGQVLSKGTSKIIDFSNIALGKGDSLLVANTDGTSPVKLTSVARGDTPLTTQIYSIKFSATDLAGNKSASDLTRTNVYVDVDNLAFARLFPTGGGLDTLEKITSRVIFKLSEPADSIIVTYTKLAGPDPAASRSRLLTGSQLTNTTSEQEIQVDSLVSGTDYILTVLGRDLAGNYTKTAPDTFRYDTAFVVPAIAKFTITADTARTGLGSTTVAGDTVTVTIQAQTVDGRNAVTYKKNAILKIGSRAPVNALGLTATGTGITDQGKGRILLNSDDWVTGRRTVTLMDTTSSDTLTVSVVDSSDTLSPKVGTLDSVIVYNPNAYTQILVSAPDTVTQGEEFWVSLTLADKFGNTRFADARFVSASTNKLGIMMPSDESMPAKGKGGFWAKASTFTGAGLWFKVRDVLPSTGALSVSSGGANNFIIGTSNNIYVRAADGGTGVALDAPDTLIAQDYKGANGEGDQGGFVILTFPLSNDHNSLSGYRIFREISVDYDVDSTGAVVALDEPKTDFIPWAKVDAVPGVALNRVVVATLDNDATFWAVAAERGRETTLTKQAFTGADVVAAPYELMAETIAKSKEAASALGKDAPIFAELTPEAQAFIANGVVPRLKTIGTADAFQSVKVLTADAIKPVDNIAPVGVSFLKAIDTPNDQGGSITLNWLRSESDRAITTTVSQAVGLSGNTFTQPGVQGYNIYRKLGDGAFSLVGKVGPGETSFSDISALNGIRYTYEVRPFDSDNETVGLQKGAMAFRNKVLDQNGKVVLGLFGQDNSVGFDDFFIFADQFGSTKDDANFEAAFDLNTAGLSQGKIDLDDFFVFADFFGRKVDAAGKVLPTLAGLNTDASLGLDAGLSLPGVGEEMAVQVDLTNFVAVKGYGFSVNYDPSLLEFVKVVAGDNNLLGEDLLAQPQVITKSDGQLSVVAYGGVATQGDLDLNLVFRAKGEIEDSYIELSNASLADDNYGINQVASLGFARVQTRPENFALGNNYPNPFNPETTIKYQLPEAADVKLEIYNVVGQVVRTLVAEHQTAGRYVVQWDASNDNGQSLSSGIYFYRVQAGSEFQQVKKMLLLK
jgi:hypothetical protein